jgi:hypothetical protein
MPDDQRALCGKRGRKRDHVADVVQDRVGGHVGGRAGAAEAAHVGRDRVKPASPSAFS